MPRGIRDSLIGQVFGRLTVVGEAPQPVGSTRAHWLCRCVCGNLVSTRGSSLKSGATQSCGCINREINNYHGMVGTPEHNAWKAMKSRCNNPKNEEYANYGGRGIQVDPRWQDSFQNFLQDMGPRPETVDESRDRSEYSVERIDTQGHYEPGNVRWASEHDQQRNKRNNRYVEFQGKRHILSDVSKQTGISRTTLRRKLDQGLSIDEIVKAAKR